MILCKTARLTSLRIQKSCAWLSYTQTRLAPYAQNTPTVTDSVRHMCLGSAASAAPRLFQFKPHTRNCIGWLAADACSRLNGVNVPNMGEQSGRSTQRPVWSATIHSVTFPRHRAPPPSLGVSPSVGSSLEASCSQRYPRVRTYYGRPT